MPELRWILIAFGVALLIGIYVWGRRSARATSAMTGAIDEAGFRARPEPAFETYEPAVRAPSDGDFLDEPVGARLDIEARTASDQPSEPTIDAPMTRADRDYRHARIEPTFGEEAVTAELPARAAEAPVHAKPTSAVAPAVMDAPTLSMSSTPQPRRIERRKIIALRLACPQRIPGAQLQASLEAESLLHGKYDVFHRLDDHGVAIFSVASMVEPGTFNLEKMPQETYPGITLFAQLPGPVAGMLAFNELVACSKRLQAALGGTLQDERGVPLTVHRIERIRQEIREFEHRPAADPTPRPSSTPSPSP